MIYSLSIIPKAEEDIISAYSWYESKSSGLGYDFIKHLDKGFKEILHDPYLYKIEYKTTRKHLIKKFPYKIIYTISDNQIVVLAVLHGKRNPKIIQKRF